MIRTAWHRGVDGEPAIRHRIVLLGAGHAHLEVVRHAAALRGDGAQVVLVDPGDAWYSGLASAVVGGRLPARRDRVDVAAVTRARGVGLRRARAVGLAGSVVRLDDGEELPFDSLSLAVGSELATGTVEVEPDAPNVIGVKPIQHHRQLRDRVRATLAVQDARVVVVGGGASAVEYAANLALLTGHGGATRTAVTIVSGADVLVPSAPDGARRRLAGLLDRRGVRVLVGTRVAAVTATHVRLATPPGLGGTLRHDVAVVATGLRAARAVELLGLGDADGMVTTTTLQHPRRPDVLGAGDAIRFAATGLPRLGVYGVRQAPVLLANLRARTTGGPMTAYRPQRSALTIMDLGGGTALALRGRRWWMGAAALVLKRVLDERWMRRHRA